MIVLLLASFSAYATEFLGGSEKEISRPVRGDLYVSGGNILLNAPVAGDFIAAGGTLVLNDTIMGDALLAGGDLLFNGYVGDDIRAAGGKIAIKKSVRGDVVVAGGQINISPQVVIFGDLVLTGGKAWVNGTVKGQVKLMGGELYLNGKVDRSECIGSHSGEYFKENSQKLWSATAFSSQAIAASISPRLACTKACRTAGKRAWLRPCGSEAYNWRACCCLPAAARHKIRVQAVKPRP